MTDPRILDVLSERRREWREEKTIESLADEIIQLNKAICIYCREELGNMNFESDEEAINYFKSFIAEEKEDERPDSHHAM